MGPQQILRAAALVAVTVASASVRAEVGPPISVVELTGERGPALRQQLRDAGFAVLSSPDLDAATAGIDGGKDLGAALASLDRAQASFGALDCPAAVAAAEAAILTLAARAAADIEVTRQLATAWSYVLLCRDRSGDVDGAMRAAAALRALGSPEATGTAAIDHALWSKYPEVDVTANLDLVALTITTDPGALVTVDQRRVGPSPAAAFVPAGRHLVAAALGSRRASAWVDVSRRASDVALHLVEQDAPLSRISERVATWRTRPADGPQVAAFLEDLLTAAQGQPWNPSSSRSPLLVVIGADGDSRRVEVWASDGPAKDPTRTALVLDDPGEPSALITTLRQRNSLWRDRAPDPEHLLVETATRERQREAAPARPQWWVYAALAGAVAIGGGVILANELSDDTQRVELRWP